ncbi:MAG: adenylosuccinate synthase [Candidatus Omnitrophota bacterium]
MANIIVVGAQWGDEGKGKVIDILTKDADYVVRYQGGNNAGHTVVIDGEEFILHLLPSGILHKGKICVIGNGVVVDPRALLDEIDALRKKNIQVDDNLKISEEVHLIFPYHKALDKLKEGKMGADKIGTTGRGIGPCYADKAARCGIRLADLLDKDVFARKLSANIKEKNEIFEKVYNFSAFKYEEVYNEYAGYGEKVAKYAVNCAKFLNDAIKKKKSVLFEGAQGTLLDIDHGTYPYVTSSNSSAGGACIGSGVPPTKIDKVVGVVKAYTTRVGEGPFPTAFMPELMEKIRQKGKEFGATTGRPRRCGWFDAVIARHSVMINGLDEIAITKLDVLDDLEEINICTAYKYKGRVYEDFPANMDILNGCEPVYETYPGWVQDTSKAKSMHLLPRNAKRYIKRLKELLGVKIMLVSVGSDRHKTLFGKNSPSF